MTQITEFFGDRIQVNSLLIVLSFVGVLALSSQSAASYPTYLLGLAMLWRWREWTDERSVRYLLMVVCLLFYLVLSGLWSEPFSLRDTVSVATRALLVVLFVIAFAECMLRERVRGWLARSLAVVATVAAALAIVRYTGTRGFQWDAGLQGYGQLDNQIIAALIFGAALIFVVDLLFTEHSPYWRALGMLCMPVLLLAIYFCESRNAWISVLIGLGVYLTSRLVNDVQKFIAGVAALGLILAVLLGALLSVEETRELLLPRGVSHRPDIWTAALTRIFDGGIWFGLGINTPDAIRVGDLVFDHPHSLYVSILWQGGILGLLLFATLIIWTLQGLIRNYGHSDAKLGLSLFSVALTGYLLDGHEFIDKVSDVWFLFWLPVAICLGLLWRKPRMRI
ncbi:MAG: O-antigen ligase family protein [Pseudomonadales bacterium]|nr:O-antigen ligase family protein [Pseudomonadales bacterium]